MSENECINRKDSPLLRFCLLSTDIKKPVFQAFMTWQQSCLCLRMFKFRGGHRTLTICCSTGSILAQQLFESRFPLSYL